MREARVEEGRELVPADLNAELHRLLGADAGNR
jgi:hypothetical protein